MILPIILFAAAWAVVAIEPSLWPVPLLGFAQNLAHTFVSRGRNSGSLVYHVIASLFSNGIYVSLLVLSISIIGYMEASGIGLFIAVFVLSTMSGSVTAHILALRLESGKARNVQEDRVRRLEARVEAVCTVMNSSAKQQNKLGARLATLEGNRAPPAEHLTDAWRKGQKAGQIGAFVSDVECLLQITDGIISNVVLWGEFSVKASFPWFQNMKRITDRLNAVLCMAGDDGKDA